MLNRSVYAQQCRTARCERQQHAQANRNVTPIAKAVQARQTLAISKTAEPATSLRPKDAPRKPGYGYRGTDSFTNIGFPVLWSSQSFGAPLEVLTGATFYMINANQGVAGLASIDIWPSAIAPGIAQMAMSYYNFDGTKTAPTYTSTPSGNPISIILPESAVITELGMYACQYQVGGTLSRSTGLVGLDVVYSLNGAQRTATAFVNKLTPTSVNFPVEGYAVQRVAVLELDGVVPLGLSTSNLSEIAWDASGCEWVMSGVASMSWMLGVTPASASYVLPADPMTIDSADAVGVSVLATHSFSNNTDEAQTYTVSFKWTEQPHFTFNIADLSAKGLWMNGVIQQASQTFNISLPDPQTPGNFLVPIWPLPATGEKTNEALAEVNPLTQTVPVTVPAGQSMQVNVTATSFTNVAAHIGCQAVFTFENLDGSMQYLTYNDVRFDLYNGSGYAGHTISTEPVAVPRFEDIHEDGWKFTPSIDVAS